VKGGLAMSQEIIDRLNELLECERAGVEAAMGLATSDAPGFSHGELQKFAEDEGWACGACGRRFSAAAGGPRSASGPSRERCWAWGPKGSG
jgi:hypothetical protein